ncbi:MAG: hypothetical protein MK041_06395, partial [Aquabacterium sp.]|nr:hypothetical protein [Aquabacterium sp.]
VDAAVMAELAQADPAQSAALINRLMEQLILEGPQQYLWGYNRYKQPRQAPDAPAAAADEAARG